MPLTVSQITIFLLHTHQFVFSTLLMFAQVPLSNLQCVSSLLLTGSWLPANFYLQERNIPALFRSPFRKVLQFL